MVLKSGSRALSAALFLLLAHASLSTSSPSPLPPPQAFQCTHTSLGSACSLLLTSLPRDSPSLSPSPPSRLSRWALASSSRVLGSSAALPTLECSAGLCAASLHMYTRGAELTVFDATLLSALLTFCPISEEGVPSLRLLNTSLTLSIVNTTRGDEIGTHQQISVPATGSAIASQNGKCTSLVLMSHFDDLVSAVPLSFAALTLSFTLDVTSMAGSRVLLLPQRNSAVRFESAHSKAVQLGDTAPPTFKACPSSDIHVRVAGMQSGAVVRWPAIRAVDRVDGDLDPILSYASGTFFLLKDSPVHVQAQVEDRAGNAAVCRCCPTTTRHLFNFPLPCSRMMQEWTCAMTTTF